MKLTFNILTDTYAICKFKTDADISHWIKNSDFYSVTKSKDELSVVCKQTDLVGDMQGQNKDWRILQICGPLDFSLIGIIADISTILKKENISIFTISTYNTDSILVKNKDLNKASDALKKHSHKIISTSQ